MVRVSGLLFVVVCLFVVCSGNNKQRAVLYIFEKERKQITS